MLFSKNRHSNSTKHLIYRKEKRQFLYLPFAIGDPNAMNLELLLSPEYYKPTMETYILVEKFMQNNIQYQTITNA